MKTLWLHLKHSISGDQQERFAVRFGLCRGSMSPVRVVELDVRHTPYRHDARVRDLACDQPNMLVEGESR